MANPIKKNVFLGLGKMGGYMAASIARRGFTTYGWNRTSDRPGVKIAAQAGVKIVDSIEKAVKDADIIVTCLGDVPDVEDLILGDLGVAKYAQPGALIVDMSTIGSPAAKKIAIALDNLGLRFMDAPVSGGDIGAKNGRLTIMVGGNTKDFEEAKPIFEAMGENITLCGDVGSGQAVKMCNQILCAINMVGLCEAIQMAQQLEIDPNLMVEVCGTGAAASWALSNLAPKIIESDYAPGFAIAHILKDLRLVGESAGYIDLPGTQLADRLFKAVAAVDGNQQGTQAMIRAYQDK